jgi:hypothetical protein
MLRIWDATTAAWIPSAISYAGTYTSSIDLDVGNVMSVIKPGIVTGLTINNSTSKQLGLTWGAPIVQGLPSPNDGYTTTAYVASGALSTTPNYYVRNNTTGVNYDTNTVASLTNTGLSSATTYSYTVYSGNVGYAASTTTNGTSKSATTKTDSVRTTKTWGAVWSESYAEGGSKRNTSYLYHGDYGGSANGNQVALIGFNIGTQIPTDATIHSVKLYLYSSHWYNNAGGDCFVYLRNAALMAEPATWTGSGTSNVSSTTASWDTKTGGKWLSLPVDFGNDLRGNGNRYFVIAASSGTNGYGYFNGAGIANEPQLQIDYTYYP